MPAGNWKKLHVDRSLYQGARAAAEVALHGLSLITGETFREASQSTLGAILLPPRIFECGSTARSTWIPALVAGASLGDIDITVDFRDPNSKTVFDALVSKLAAPCRTWQVLFQRRGMEAKIRTATDEAKKSPERYRGYHRFRYSVQPLDMDVEVHVCIWGGLTYTDVFDTQSRQISQIGGPRAMHSVISGIHVAKRLFAQAGLYKTEPNHDAVPGVGIEQLIIQTGRKGDNPLVIETLPSFRKAMTWIVQRTEVLGSPSRSSAPRAPEIDTCHVPGICELGRVNFYERLTLEGWRKLRHLAAVGMSSP